MFAQNSTPEQAPNLGSIHDFRFFSSNSVSLNGTQIELSVMNYSRIDVVCLKWLEWMMFAEIKYDWVVSNWQEQGYCCGIAPISLIDDPIDHGNVIFHVTHGIIEIIFC